MARIFLLSLTTSLLALWVVTVKAGSWHGPEYSYPNFALHTHGHTNGFTHPTAYVWPHTNLEPAIGKTLTLNHAQSMPNEPSADYRYEWQYQPAPPAPHLATPQQFAHPKQGYFPREGKIEQVPGYEYDFGGTGTYPPLTPMEGATWLEPRKASVKSRLHVQQPFAHDSGFETHYGCLHW